MKFGFIPVLMSEDSDLSKLIALSFSNLSNDRRKIESFIKDIFKSIESGRALDEESIRKFFAAQSNGETLNLSSHDSIEALKKITSFSERLGITKDGGIFGNGGNLA